MQGLAETEWEEGYENKKTKPTRGGEERAEEKQKPGAMNIKLSIARDEQQKHVAMVTGLGPHGIDLTAAAEFFGQKFACGSSVTEDDEIVIQGDVKDDLLRLIPKKWPNVGEEQIEDLDELDNGKILPLAGISPSRSGGTVRAYVKSKDPIRSYQNAKGPGSVFGMWLQDESEEVKCCAFGNEATTFHELVEVGKWYYIRDAGIIVPKDELYSRGKQYEMLMMPETLVTPCLYMRDRPKVQFHFTPISKLGEKLAGADVVLSRDLIKRNIELREQEFSVRVTLSGSSAENFDEGSVNQVVAIKDCSVSDSGGLTLSTVSWSNIVVDPDVEEAHMLRGWYQTEGANTAAQPVAAEIPAPTTHWKCFLMVKDPQEQGSGYAGCKPEYFQVKVTVMKVTISANRRSCTKAVPAHS